MRLNRVRAVDISDAMITCLQNLGLSLSTFRGQGYDGASAMSGIKAGVQARIKEKQTKDCLYALLRACIEFFNCRFLFNPLCNKLH